MIFSSGGIPRPDPDVTKLENDLIKGQGLGTLTAKMAQVQISDTSKDTWFPRRPAFGTAGTAVVLWANYFKLDVSTEVPLLKYSLKAERKNKRPVAQKKGKKAKGQKAAEQDTGPKGKKLHSIIKSALDQVAKSVTYATEFKDQVISLEPFTLPDSQIVIVQYGDEGKDDVYEVKFSGPTTVDLPGLLNYLRTMHDPSGDTSFPKFETAVDAISVITGHYARNNPNTAALGRSRYFPLQLEGETHDLGQPEFNRIIRGYFQSARPATGRLILNTNVAHGVFRPKGLVSDLAPKFLNYNGSPDYQSLHSSLSKLRARCKVLSEDGKNARYYQKVICGLAMTNDGNTRQQHAGDGPPPIPPSVPHFAAKAKDVKFHLRAPAPAGLQANALCSVADYYKKRYGYTVNPNFPVVNVGTKAKPVYMPAEFVEVLDGQPLRRKTTPNETRDMINFSCRSPFANAASISTFGRQVLGLDNPQFLKRFGIQVGDRLLTVQGRELSPPTIVYKDVKPAGGTKHVAVREGEWNMENVRVYKPGKRIDRWFWISIDEGYRAHQGHDQVLESMRKWISFLQSQGIDIANAPLNGTTQVTVQRSPEDAIRAVFKEMQKQNPQFAFVVLPGRKTDQRIYNEVKRLGDTEFGYHTQNVLRLNLTKNNPQLFANLGLKINLKMGGVNHKLKDDLPILKQGRTMIAGYDVTHPTNLAGDTKGLPSFVGMVASVDHDLGQWPGTAWKQSGRVEMLDQRLEEQFTEHLKLYRKHSQVLPQNIIIYRDGVSEGQFQQVLEKELPFIRKACEQTYPASQRPKITVIVSVKRHQTRFYPTDPKNMVRSRNIKNGTVVDRGVTQAATWDFFLTAHKGLQGTSRPAHYTVLYDEVFRGLSPNEAANQLEKLTYELCHVFGRATKAVSIVPPAYYADILCTRKRCYHSALFDTSDTRSTVSSTSTEQDGPAFNIHQNLAGSMFYI
ncbi:hypothetical protein NUW58_g2785 [Xylaria curta]|uniref:Uncharacterized protein n=1 Tax=Xylaria curta TaxID=42375 RepID=A0ACC1PEW4_9PEZI|nr:hypothetical protein NUW58_g2785 [Xylaria curta]